IVRNPEIAALPVVDSNSMHRASRYRRFVTMIFHGGRSVLLDHPEASHIAHDYALQLNDGILVRVIAAPQPLMEIHAADAHALARSAWHLGNRHTPAEITADAIYIQPDHVLEAMVVGLGAHVHAVVRPFEPEGGA